MRSEGTTAARKAALHLEALGQYIQELELDNAALKKALVTSAVGELCVLCANLPLPVRCFPADLDCSACTETGCKCKKCSKDYNEFVWKGREK